VLPGALIDTGAILAILDRDDYWHSACTQALGALRIPLLTTEAVLTETFHLIGSSAYNMQRLWAFALSGALTVRTVGDSDLLELRSLMTKYRDRPMDFADATLVHAANCESLSVVLTIDYDDFETYRLKGNKKFTIRPIRRAR
jgi:predicted nucleic acid-binding protein